MKKLTDISQEIVEIPVNLEYVRDLEWFDGPLLTEFRASNGDPYLYKWCELDEDEGAHRWILFEASHTRIKDYVEYKISLRDLMLSTPPNHVFLVDMVEGGTVRQVGRLHKEQIPAEYLPYQGAMYAP